MSRLRTPGTVVAIAAVSLLVASTGFWGTLERYLYDLHVRGAIGLMPPEPLVIVAIDDATLNVMADRLGGMKWPYPRAAHAKVVENLARLGARAVFLDILFDIPSGYGAKDDEALERALRRLPAVLAAETDRGVRNLPLERFIAAGARPGNAIVPVDADGVVRDPFGGRGFPKGFASSLGYFLGGWGGCGEGRSAARGEALPSAAEAVLPLLGRGESGGGVPDPGMIRFFGPPGSFRTVSYFELYDDALAQQHRDLLAGRIALVGRALYAPLTPGQQSDLFLTPYRPHFMAGVEIHAHALASLVVGRSIRLVPAWVYPLLFIAWAIACAVLFGRIKQPLAEFLALVGMAAALEGAAYWLLHQDLVLQVGPLLIFSSLYFVTAALQKYIRERDAKLLIRAQLFRYLPERVATHMISRPLRMAMAGDRSEITVLFADLAGFTTLSEALPTDTVITLLQGHLKEMTEAIFAHEGTLDKFLGDGVMAFWGAPDPQERQADMAIAAGREMLQRVERANAEREKAGLPALRLRIGIHSGEAVVGNVGSSLYIDYTAIGDTVNTASRTEGINKFFGTRMLISDACLARAGEAAREGMFLVGRVSAKGKKKAISYYTPAAAAAETELFQELGGALESLDRRENDRAATSLSALLAKNPGFGPARFHLELLIDGAPLRYDEEGRHYRSLDEK